MRAHRPREFQIGFNEGIKDMFTPNEYGLFSMPTLETCLLYTSDAADEL